MLMFILLDLTLRDVISDIPHDGPAFVAYGVIGLILVFIWLGSRNNERPDTENERAPRHDGE